MIYEDDLFRVLPTLAEGSIDLLMTDPPYGLGIQGRQWDTFRPGATDNQIRDNTPDAPENPNLKGRQRSPHTSPSAIEYDRSLRGQRAFQAYCESWGREALRVLKPGAHALVCGAPRSYHRMVCGLEDAGFEVRDAFTFLCDHTDIFAELIDSMSDEQVEVLLRVLGSLDGHLAWVFGQGMPKSKKLAPGVGNGLKPAFEPIALLRKPLPKKLTLVKTYQAFGTAGLNLADAQIDGEPDTDDQHERWPTNALFDESIGALLSRRFFYVAKPSRSERDKGLDSLPVVAGGAATNRKEGSAGLKNARAGAGRGGRARNIHPTVKPVDLMRYLVRLACPPGGTVLDPFAGSFTTAVACVHEGRDYVCIEREPRYVEIGRRRINAISPLFHDAFGS